MSRKRTVLAAGIGAAVTVAVYQGTALVQAGQDPPRVMAAGATMRLGAPPQRTEAPVPPPDEGEDEKIRALEAQNALLQRMLEDLETELRGTPIPWTDDIPEALRPEAFERNVRAAIEACAPELEIVGFECSEPPCLAMLRSPPEYAWWDPLVNDCPAWRDHYTNAVASASGTATCPDGSTEPYQLLGWSRKLVEPEGGLDPAEKENANKRFTARIDEIAHSWPCAAN